MCIRDRDISPVVFADGVNEKGFAAASLYFPGYASYDSFESGEKQVQGSSGPSVAAIELVRFLLSFCSSVQEAASLLQTVQIVGTTDAVTNSVAPLHWITADSSGSCMVIEKTRTGLHLWNNPVGVLSNLSLIHILCRCPHNRMYSPALSMDTRSQSRTK